MNVQELIAEIESRYTCEVGPQKGCFELDGVELWYRTISFATDNIQGEDELCLTLLAALPPADKGIRLFWRRTEKIGLEMCYGQAGRVRLYIRTRLVTTNAEWRRPIHQRRAVGAKILGFNNVYPSYSSYSKSEVSIFHYTRESADKCASTDRIRLETVFA